MVNPLAGIGLALKKSSLGFAVIHPHIWRQRVGQIGNLSYSWAGTTAIPNEPKKIGNRAKLERKP